MRVLMITIKVDMKDELFGFAHTWINKLAEKVDRLYVIATEVGKASALKNVELYSVGKLGCDKLRMLFNFNKIMIMLLLRRKIDVIFVHMAPEYAILVSPFAKIKKIPIVMWYTHKNVDAKLKISNFLVNRIVTASKESCRIKSKKIIVTGHGIDTDKFKKQNVGFKKSKTTKIVLSVGRVSPIKNYETLIQTANILINKYERKDIIFFIVGGVPGGQEEYFKKLKEMIKLFKLEKFVKFTGAVSFSEVHNYYQNCDISVNLCSTGGLDKAVLEAMATEKPVLVCNETFCKILGDYNRMLIFREKDFEDLAQKIVHIIEMNDEFKSIMGRDLRDIVISEHSVEGLVYKFVRIFRDVMKH